MQYSDPGPDWKFFRTSLLLWLGLVVIWLVQTLSVLTAVVFLASRF